MAAGSLSASLASGGRLNVALVPNADAAPAGTYYKVVCLNASVWAKTS